MSLKDVLHDISLDQAWTHLEWLNENAPERVSGTPDQIRAGEYFAERLSEYGLETHRDTYTAYRSVPQRGSFQLISPSVKELPCEPCGHIVSTPDEGLEVNLLYLGGGSEADYEGRDVRGTAVLTEISAGPSRPKKARIAAQHGAAAIVFLNWGLPEYDTIPCGAIKCVWGNPTRATLPDVPQIAALGITRAAANEVIALLQQGPVRARIVAQATRDWGPLTQPWARIRAANNSTGDYLLIGGHYDAWKPGMTDNAAGNALKLELARVFARRRDSLSRDIVFGFWNGHEVGDYEGSTWFADRYWDELDEHCVAYFNVDSVGFAHSSFYLGDSTPELKDFHQRIERQVLGVETGHRHLNRDNEHPFFGLGLPALEGRFHFSKEQIAAWGGARGGWWWHSLADTLDKIDRDRYQATANIFASYVWQMCTSRVLPMDFSTTAQLVQESVVEMREVADGRFNLDLPVTPFVGAIEQLGDATAAVTKEADIALLNRTLMRLSRILLPAFETAGGRYEQDRYELSALNSAIPALHDLKLLAATPPDDELSNLLYTELLRQRNRLSDALRWATAEIRESLA
jgi:hypothetical protein